MPSKTRLVLVEWVDSCSVNETWDFVKDLEEPYPVICNSVGWVLKQNDDCILIVPHISDVQNEDSLGACKGGLIIPREMIRNIISIKL